MVKWIARKIEVNDEIFHKGHKGFHPSGENLRDLLNFYLDEFMFYFVKVILFS